MRDGFPCWVDLGVHDVDAALAFYANAMGWRAGERSGAEFGGYAMWFNGDIPTAGVGPAREGASPCWTTYLATSDIDRTLALAEAASEWMIYFAVDDVDAAATRVDADGGQIVREMRTSAVGTMATFADPEGATFSVIA